jgi:hypothetical protein
VAWLDRDETAEAFAERDDRPEAPDVEGTLRARSAGILQGVVETRGVTASDLRTSCHSADAAAYVSRNQTSPTE